MNSIDRPSVTLNEERREGKVHSLGNDSLGTPSVFLNLTIHFCVLILFQGSVDSLVQIRLSYRDSQRRVLLTREEYQRNSLRKDFFRREQIQLGCSERHFVFLVKMKHDFLRVYKHFIK